MPGAISTLDDLVLDRANGAVDAAGGQDLVAGREVVLHPRLLDLRGAAAAGSGTATGAPNSTMMMIR